MFLVHQDTFITHHIYLFSYSIFFDIQKMAIKINSEIDFD